ncbi:MAG: oligoendopeptidase F [Mycobacterium leprae]
MPERLTRAQVPTEQTWNLTDLFESEEAWQKEMAAIEGAFPTVAQYEGKLGEGPQVFLNCLEAEEALYARFIRWATYASLRMSQEGNNPVNQGMAGQAAALGAKLSAVTSFTETEPLRLPDGTLERYMAEEPKLQEFKKTIKDLLDKKPHVLSPETEVALASLGEVTDAPHMIYERAKSGDMRFESVTDSEGKQHANSFALYEDHLESSSDMTLRRNSFAAFTNGLKAYQNTFAATWGTEVKKNVAMAKLRHYSSATEMLLDRHKVPLEIYNNLLDTIQTELAPHMRRYARLRKKVLGMDKMLYCDIEAPLDPTYNPPATYEDVKKLILEATSVMGPEYSKIIRTALNERWIDLADNVGKSTGAFCSSPYGAHSFILITFTNNMRSAFVLAHELGHAGHFQLAQRYNRLSNTRPSTFFVEAPSTINELLMGNYLFAQSNDVRMRRWVAMTLLATYHHNFVRHLLEGELQRRMYDLAEKGGTITAKSLSETKGAILQSFWGDEVEIDDGARLTWMRQPHYYMGLYPYTYSAGLTTATAVAQMIKEEGQPAVDRWLDTLKAGGTLNPLDLMKKAGVDMTTTAPIKKAVAFVGGLVDEIEKSF